MVWTAYDVGASGYAEASGVANALMNNNQVRIRIVPSGTSIGRLLPLVTGKANLGFLSNEVYFATEPIHDFAVQRWGPQARSDDRRVGQERASTVSSRWPPHH